MESFTDQFGSSVVVESNHSNIPQPATETNDGMVCANPNTTRAETYDTEQQDVVPAESTKEPPKPSRPLTAYNIFFKHTRKAMLDSLPDVEPQKTKTLAAKRSPAPGTKVPHRKIGFADLARQIAAKWKVATPEEQAYFLELAKRDKERYVAQMSVWKRDKREHAKKERHRKGRLKSPKQKSETKRKSAPTSTQTKSSPPRRMPRLTLHDQARPQQESTLPPTSTPRSTIFLTHYGVTPTKTAEFAPQDLSLASLPTTDTHGLPQQATSSLAHGDSNNKMNPAGDSNLKHRVSLLSLLKSRQKTDPAVPPPPLLKTSDSEDVIKWWRAINPELLDSRDMPSTADLLFLEATLTSPPNALPKTPPKAAEETTIPLHLVSTMEEEAKLSNSPSHQPTLNSLPVMSEDGPWLGTMASWITRSHHPAAAVASSTSTMDHADSTESVSMIDPTPLKDGSERQAGMFNDLADAMGYECTDLFLDLFQN
mmetsp:Transcript_86/g.367  ORF Transcript_86/g.367 Transcript_86/m.367 type:complete len:482 (-) Transcript_86:117-1562(-)